MNHLQRRGPQGLRPGLRRLVLAAVLTGLVSAPAVGVVDVNDSIPPASAVGAGAVTNDYPYSGATSGVDEWNFYKGQCTSFVAWRINDRLGISFTNQYGPQDFGHAYNWDNAALAAGLTVSSIPAPGAVAQTDSGTYGHVAWVSKVNPGGTVTIEEYNWGTPNTYGSRTVPTSSFRYIYFGRVGNPHKSVNSDRFGDVLAVDSSDRLYTYPGTSAGTLGTRQYIGGGWNYSKVGMGDASGDGLADIYAIDGAGYLWYYDSAGGNTFDARKSVGNGWSIMLRIAVTDMTGDGRADIVAIRNDDRLVVYPANSDGTLRSPVVYGTGWGGMTRFGAGDANGDGYGDIYASDSDGDLWYYRGTLGNGFASPVKVGIGWTIFDRILVNDITGDGFADIIGIKPDGTMWFYRGDGDGTVAAGQQIGQGWSTFQVAS